MFQRQVVDEEGQPVAASDWSAATDVFQMELPVLCIDGQLCVWIPLAAEAVPVLDVDAKISRFLFPICTKTRAQFAA